MLFLAAAHPLVHVNASLNCLATILLVTGYVLIRRRNEAAHKRVMLAAFGASVAFLACYLTYHTITPHTPFQHEGAVRYVYYAILFTHFPLAATVPFLAIPTIVLGMRAHNNWLPKRIRRSSDAEKKDFVQNCRERHRRLAKITFPIWLYVSITGVVVYYMLYHL